MNKTDVIERLIHFQMSRQEALVYICLWENEHLTGYEASKLTGISRSNIYGVLSSLTEKGAAVVTETNTTLYQAVCPQEFLTHKMRHLEEDAAYLLKHMPRRAVKEEGYITIQGSDNIKDKIQYMIKHCEMRLYFAADGKTLSAFEDCLAEAKGRGLKVVLMSDGNYSHLATQFYPDRPKEGQIRLITDSTYVLTGELQGRSTDTCLYSGQKNLVTIMKEALRNKIRLLEME